MSAGYKEFSEITINSISGENGLILRPRVNSKSEQEYRSRNKAEVFTSAWICNRQNNLIDAAWFGTDKSPFNTETENGWITNTNNIKLTNDKTWQDHIKDTRLEMTCGETPYLVSRYNVVTGEEISVRMIELVILTENLKFLMKIFLMRMNGSKRNDDTWAIARLHHSAVHQQILIEIGGSVPVFLTHVSVCSVQEILGFCLYLVNCNNSTLR